MSAEENKALIRRYYEEINKGNVAIDDEIMVEGVVYNGDQIGREGMKQFSTMLRTAFPDFRIDLEEMVAERDMVVTYFTFSGTHQEDFMGIPPTGRSFRSKGMDLYRLVEGKIVEIRDVVDVYEWLKQLGVIPAPEQAEEVTPT